MSPDPEITVNVNEDTDTASVDTWDGDDDPRNPRNWSTARKLSIICLVTFATFNEYALDLSSISSHVTDRHV